MYVCECGCVCVSSALWQGLAKSVCACSLQCSPQLSLHFCVCVCYSAAGGVTEGGKMAVCGYSNAQTESPACASHVSDLKLSLYKRSKPRM